MGVLAPAKPQVLRASDTVILVLQRGAAAEDGREGSVLGRTPLPRSTSRPLRALLRYSIAGCCDQFVFYLLLFSIFTYFQEIIGRNLRCFLSSFPSLFFLRSPVLKLLGKAEQDRLGGLESWGGTSTLGEGSSLQEDYLMRDAAAQASGGGCQGGGRV